MSQPHSSKPTSTIFSSVPSPQWTLLFLLFLCTVGFYTLHLPNSAAAFSNVRNALRFRNIYLSFATNSTVSAYLRALTLHPHLAGTHPALQTARFVYSHFADLGLRTHTVQYRALLSYPLHASLSAHFSDGSSRELPLVEPGGAGAEVVRPYHAYSPSGAVTGAQAVYVNLGREEDYRALRRVGVDVKGCVAVVRRGEESRGGVVGRAAEEGAVAVLMYTEGESMGGVERGTVMKGLGDPLTPGWGGVEGGEALDLEDSQILNRFPKIPSMPISPEVAYSILRSLEGPPMPHHWRGDALGPQPGRVGPGPTLLNFTYLAEKKIATIHNVFAIIRGSEEPDRYVLLGNHRDAWTYGAVDPNSGTAVLLDIARRYALMMRQGWRPRRTIVLCSWDAEEFGMIGSTEWVEQNLLNLGSKVVAYLNVDCAVQGPGFFAGATPQLDNLIIEVAKKVQDPDSESMTIYDNWMITNKVINVQRLSGVDSDFAPLLQHAGVPSVDLYYGRDFPVYHTAFDSYNWMTNHGDPLFQRHVAVAGVWGLLALHLADDPILPFNYVSYTEQLWVGICYLSFIIAYFLSH
ncbi:hypothetical protein PVL29_009662 [Vitis rotundifolia]|uniref:glutamate carboxypeptidase II n=1 Tax=Vitis rotundifolia TaxID=103349 RepID=A0AA38ZR77_VITRO|nr:hypothetical protein PVL29_009662 [Vitis rotundifolia]